MIFELLALYYLLPADFLATLFFKAGSLFTNPVCRAHENYLFAMATGDVMHYLSAFFWALLGIFTTPLAIGSRALAIHIQTAPFGFSPSAEKPKELSGSFSLFSWNICCIGGGYAISDGGVLPWSYRIEKIKDKIIEQDADVVCLYEVFDFDAASYLSASLSDRYDCYYNIGAKTVGVSSGIFVASKYEIKKAEFTPFPERTLVGRTKAAAKGVFRFEIGSKHKPVVIYATHLQHSELPQFPTQEELIAREEQMQMVLKMLSKEGSEIVTGDLNLGDEEMNASTWRSHFEKGDLFSKKTWGGDGYCARLMQKSVSSPINLDHTLARKESVKKIETRLVEVGYDADEFREDALSDHAGLYSQVTLQ